MDEEEILQIMGRTKSKINMNINKLHKEIKQKCRIAQETLLNRKLMELDEPREDPKSMHKNVKGLAGFRSHITASGLKANDGNILIDKDEVIERWAKYNKSEMHS